MITQNKARTYLLYAVGEIALVMIGILLALQVNNWNEAARLSEKEQQVMFSLSGELASNIPILKECQRVISEMIAQADSLQEYLGPKNANLPHSKIIPLFASIGATERCKLQTDVLNELRSSGNLNILRNNELRRTVSSWSTAFNELKKEEDEWSREFSTINVPYLNKWISWDDLDKYYNPDDPDYLPSAFDYDPNRVLQEFEFANVLNVTAWRLNRVKERTESLENISENMLLLLNKEIK